MARKHIPHPTKDEIKLTTGPFYRLRYDGKGRMGITGIYGAVFCERGDTVVVSRAWAAICRDRDEWIELGLEEELLEAEKKAAKPKEVN